jgi:hypothetical protein
VLRVVFPSGGRLTFAKRAEAMIALGATGGRPMTTAPAFTAR